MNEIILDESMLEDVNGGVGGDNFTKLPLHTCKNGKTGKLVYMGYGAGNRKLYRCSNCGKEGRINFIAGTRELCDLIK